MRCATLWWRVAVAAVLSSTVLGTVSAQPAPASADQSAKAPRYPRQGEAQPTSPAATQAGSQTQPRAASLTAAEREKLEKAIQEEVSGKVLREVFPATPETVEQLSKENQEIRRAMRAGSKPTAVPVLRTLMADLSSKGSPPPIRIEWGMTTTVSFFDAYGNPWPVQFARSGDEGVARIGMDKKEERGGKQPNFVVLEVGKADGRFRSSNLTVMLEGQRAPLVFWLLPNQSQVDFRLDVTVPQGVAPGGKAPDQGGGASYDTVLHQIGNGTLPAGMGKPVKVVSDPLAAIVQVLEVGEHLIVTTRIPVIAPAPMSTTTTTDGRMVYRVARTPVLTVAGNAGIEFVRLGL